MERLAEYEIAWLVGGSERAALVAFVALAKDGRLKVAYKRQRVHDYKSTLNLGGCDPASGRLAPGHYQLHALQRFTVFDEDLNRGTHDPCAGWALGDRKLVNAIGRDN
jgi:uncharacterized protein (TIGR04222 family)